MDERVGSSLLLYNNMLFIKSQQYFIFNTYFFNNMILHNFVGVESLELSLDYNIKTNISIIVNHEPGSACRRDF